MDRVAVFVDAGYLYAQGSTALVGSKRLRSGIVLDEAAFVSAIGQFALTCDSGTSLLRIYWYDGLGAGRETPEQKRIAESANVKMRFGVINYSGEQKGVDSLIVTDMVDLARAGAIVSAVVLSGDEDVRIGVEIAQRYGVRIHLLGIVPSRGSQSLLLLREADTTTEWDATLVKGFLSVVPDVPATTLQNEPAPASSAVVLIPQVPSAASTIETEAAISPDTLSLLRQAASAVAQTVAGTEVRQIVTDWDARVGLPRTTDSLLLTHGRAALKRNLYDIEKPVLRRALIELLRPLQPNN